jgi:cytochrome d ubiquinol oxidase subunit II
MVDGSLIPVISQWGNNWHGLDALLDLWNVALGLAVFFLARILGILYFINNINDDELLPKCRRSLIIQTALFLVFFLAFVARTLLVNGFAVDPVTQDIFPQPYKYLHNLIEMPVVLAVFLVGVALVLFGILKSLLKPAFTKGIWFAGSGTVLTVLALFLLAGFNNTAYYPSNLNIQNSLTIANSCSSKFTLEVMAYVSILVPFILAYIFYAWRSIDRKKIDVKEMNSGDHTY